MSDDSTVQSVVNGVLEQTGTTVDQTLAQTDGIVDQTLAQTDGIVDQTLSQTDGVVDQTLSQTDGVVDQTLSGTRPAVDRALEQTGVGGGRTETGATPAEPAGQPAASAPESAPVGDDRAAAPDATAPPASHGAPDPVRDGTHHAAPAGGHETIGDPTVAAPPDLPTGAPHFPDPTAVQPPADAIAAAPGPPPDALAPPPTPGAGSFLDALLDAPTDPRMLSAAGLALIVGVGGAAIPRSAAITDSRLMIQLGMLVGFVYAAFLSVWFWATRLRVPTYRAPSGR